MTSYSRPCLLLYTEAPTKGGTSNGIDVIIRGLHHEYGISCVVHESLLASGWPQDSLKVRLDRLSTSALRAPWIRNPIRWLLSLIGYVRLLQEMRPAVTHFHLHTPFACNVAVLLTRSFSNSKIVVTEQYLSQLRFLRHRKRGVVLTVLRDLVIRWNMFVKRMVLRMTDAVILVSTGDRVFLLERFGSWLSEKSLVLFNMVQPEAYQDASPAQLRVPTGSLVVLIPAELNNQKGHRYLLQAIPDVLREVPNVVFLLAGDGHLRKYLEELADNLGIRNSVFFLGRRSDISNLLALADLVALPSLFEGLPFALLEAMASGKAVVATDIPGIRDAVIPGVTGLLCDPMNSAQFGQNLITLLQNNQMRKNMAHAGRIRARDVFDERNSYGQLDHIYKKAAASR